MLVGLIPLLAAASPPDPTWIGGIYDAADGDEIITLIGDQASSNGVAVYVIGRPIELRQALLQREPCTTQGFFERRLNRGPPSGPASTSPLLHISPLVHFVCVGPHQPASALREPTPRDRTTPSAAVIQGWCVTLKQKAPAVAQPRAQAALRGASVADVVTAVNFARQNDSVVAVRGTGHDVAGTAVCDRGLMIELSFGLAATAGFVGATGVWGQRSAADSASSECRR